MLNEDDLRLYRSFEDELYDEELTQQVSLSLATLQSVSSLAGFR